MVSGNALMLSSLTAVTKEPPIVAMILGRSSPDPGPGAPVELSSRDTGGVLDLFGIGKTLAHHGVLALAVS